MNNTTKNPPMIRDLEEMAFGDLVEWAVGIFVKHLMEGDFKEGVWYVLDTAVKWQRVQDEKK